MAFMYVPVARAFGHINLYSTNFCVKRINKHGTRTRNIQSHVYLLFPLYKSLNKHAQLAHRTTHTLYKYMARHHCNNYLLEIFAWSLAHLLPLSPFQSTNPKVLPQCMYHIINSANILLIECVTTVSVQMD